MHRSFVGSNDIRLYLLSKTGFSRGENVFLLRIVMSSEYPFTFKGIPLPASLSFAINVKNLKDSH